MFLARAVRLYKIIMINIQSMICTAFDFLYKLLIICTVPIDARQSFSGQLIRFETN